MPGAGAYSHRQRYIEKRQALRDKAQPTEPRTALHQACNQALTSRRETLWQTERVSIALNEAVKPPSAVARMQNCSGVSVRRAVAYVRLCGVVQKRSETTVTMSAVLPNEFVRFRKAIGKKGRESAAPGNSCATIRKGVEKSPNKLGISPRPFAPRQKRHAQRLLKHDNRCRNSRSYCSVNGRWRTGRNKPS